MSASSLLTIEQFSIDELRSDPANPRRIGAEELDSLERSPTVTASHLPEKVVFSLAVEPTPSMMDGMVFFDAYAADCRVHGEVEVGEGRLSDGLGQAEELLVRSVRLEGLEDGRTVKMLELTVARDEICAVVAGWPRGDAARRLHTQTRLVEAEVGPYLIVGRVHGTPASEPLGAALRQPWVPLTEATVMYRCGGEDVREEMATLLVNRDRMNSFRAVEHASVDLLRERHAAPKNAATEAATPTDAATPPAKPRKAARPRVKKASPAISPEPPA